MTPAPPSRKQARRDALFVLYQREVTGEPVEVLLTKLQQREGYEPDEFTVESVTGVAASQDILDATLQRYSRDWALSRMAAIERSALRLGLYEIESGTVPPEVAVDEAVRLVRRYASDEGGSLVNGILGAVLRERQKAGEEGLPLDEGATPDEGALPDEDATPDEGASQEEGMTPREGTDDDEEE